MPTPSQKPTLGRIVLTKIKDNRGEEQVRAADITRVFSEETGCVQLTVKLDAFNDFPCSDAGVPVFHTGVSSALYVDGVEQLALGTWTYPPRA